QSARRRQSQGLPALLWRSTRTASLRRSERALLESYRQKDLGQVIARHERRLRPVERLAGEGLALHEIPQSIGRQCHASLETDALGRIANVKITRERCAVARKGMAFQ